MELELLDWVLIGLVAAAGILLGLFLLFMFNFFMSKRNLAAIKKRRPKNKKKRKGWLREFKTIEKRKKFRFRMMIVFVLLGISCGGAGFYIKYYQMTNLADSDSEALVQSYFLISSIEEEIKNVAEADSTKQVQATVYDYSARLASYGAKTPDPRLSKDGTLLLKRLYQSMKELGLNLTGITEEGLVDPVVIEEYTSDIEKVRDNQAQVFKYFRINESSLKQDT